LCSLTLLQIKTAGASNAAVTGNQHSWHHNQLLLLLLL